jgi:hypothetical protein
MRCPACNTENDNGVATCKACQTSLTAKRKRRGDSRTDVPPTPRAQALTRQALRAWRLCLGGLVPFAGLVLGPAAALQARAVERSARDEPTFTAHALLRLSRRLGLVIAVANWLGLGLMALGLYLGW